MIQCYINIFNNAKDALKTTAQTKKYFFITIKKTKTNVIIYLKDNAGGIPEEILPRVFEPYFTTKHKSQGTGLGLHMTYKLIVNGMHGDIKVENTTYNYDKNNYKGAVFTISLPIDTKK